MTSRARLVLAATTVAAVALAGGASAAPAKPCNLMVDPAGDASFLGAAPNDRSLDIRSADVATDAKTLTGVLRLDAFSAVSPGSPLGRGYYVQFNVPGASFPIYLNLQITPDLTRYTWGTLETLPNGSGRYVRKGDATGVVDGAANELRVSVPLSALATVTRIKPGTKLSALTATTTSVIGTSASGGLVATVDTAESSKSYITGSPSCVVPGK